MVVEVNFSADTKGERRCGLFAGDGAFFVRDSLRLFEVFSSLVDVFFSDLVFFSGVSRLDFFVADFSDDVAGLPLFLKKSSQGISLNELKNTCKVALFACYNVTVKNSKLYS